MSWDILGSVLWGVGLCAANFLVAHIIARWAMRRPFRSFLRWVLGGMVARLIAISACAFVLLAAGRVEPAGFALSFALSVVLFLTVEVIDFHRRYETFRLRPLAA